MRNEDLLERITRDNLPEVAVHGTYRENITNILLCGLVPGGGGRS